MEDPKPESDPDPNPYPYPLVRGADPNPNPDPLVRGTYPDRVLFAGAGECVREHEAGPARHPGGARQVPVQPAGPLLYLTCVPEP